jgi:hypothetical protein
MTSTNIDYIDTYFQIPVLTKLHGEPTYDTLTTLRDEIKTNAITVNSTLGGGNYGHLGLVLPATEYAAIPNTTAYTRPPNPGVLVIQPNTPNHEAVRRESEHREEKRIWRECIDVEQALLKQIVAAVDPKYLKALRSKLTNKITKNVSEVFEYLFDRYGVVPPDVLAEKEKFVRETPYDPREPLSTVFDSLEELEDLGKAAQLPYTAAQIISFAHEILMRSNIFENSLITWNEKTAVNKTWVNFKSHFENAHKALRLVRGKTMSDSGFQQANYLATQVLVEMQQVQDPFFKPFKILTEVIRKTTHQL